MSLRLITWNVNSLRSAVRHGFCEWLKETSPDIVCLQEIRGTLDQLQPLEKLFPGYVSIWHPAVRPGYAGTGILSRFKPLSVERGLNGEPDPEGRALTIDLGPFRVASLYVQNAQPRTPKIAFKSAWLKKLQTHVAKKSDTPFFVLGDLNVAHAAFDSRGMEHPPGINGCTDEERAAFQSLLDDCNLIDPLRARNGKNILSTWWHAGTGKMDRLDDGGIRFDYALLPSKQANLVVDTVIHPEVEGSDHCPVSLILDLSTDHLKPVTSTGQVGFF